MWRVPIFISTLLQLGLALKCPTCQDISCENGPHLLECTNNTITSLISATTRNKYQTKKNDQYGCLDVEFTEDGKNRRARQCEAILRNGDICAILKEEKTVEKCTFKLGKKTGNRRRLKSTWKTENSTGTYQFKGATNRTRSKSASKRRPTLLTSPNSQTKLVIKSTTPSLVVQSVTTEQYKGMSDFVTFPNLSIAPPFTEFFRGDYDANMNQEEVSIKPPKTTDDDNLPILNETVGLKSQTSSFFQSEVPENLHSLKPTTVEKFAETPIKHSPPQSILKNETVPISLTLLKSSTVAYMKLGSNTQTPSFSFEGTRSSRNHRKITFKEVFATKPPAISQNSQTDNLAKSKKSSKSLQLLTTTTLKLDLTEMTLSIKRNSQELFPTKLSPGTSSMPGLFTSRAATPPKKELLMSTTASFKHKNSSLNSSVPLKPLTTLRTSEIPIHRNERAGSTLKPKRSLTSRASAPTSSTRGDQRITQTQKPIESTSIIPSKNSVGIKQLSIITVIGLIVILYL